jgi:nucleoside-diphosphate-sugar epimerase
VTRGIAAETIVTGGGGFIGFNAASRELQRGHDVVVIDNLSRPSSSKVPRTNM